MNTDCATAAEGCVHPRLVCFHHAGGDGSLFAGWQRALGHGVHVLPVTLPHRDASPRPDFAGVLAELDRTLDDRLPGDYHVYGHSMGALVAYEFVAARALRGASAPGVLCVGAFPPPQDVHVLARTELSPADVTNLLLEMTGLPASVLEYRDWVTTMTRALTADLDLLRSHRYRPRPPLPCPIHVFGAADDRLAPLREMAGWSAQSAVGTQVHRIDGGHFFVRERRADFLSALRTVLGLHDVSEEP